MLLVINTMVRILERGITTGPGISLTTKRTWLALVYSSFVLQFQQLKTTNKVRRRMER